MRRLPLALFFSLLIAVEASAAGTAAEPESKDSSPACKAIAEKIKKTKSFRPEELNAFLGKDQDEFPCKTTGGAGAGASDHGFEELSLGDRKVGMVTKALYKDQQLQRREILDIALFPKVPKEQVFLNTLYCSQKKPKRSAVAIARSYPIKNSDLRRYAVKKAWVIDKKTWKLKKASASSVQCEDDAYAVP